MINLKKLIKKNLKFFYFFYFFFFILKILFSSENKIIFKINDKAFTTLDYEKRIKYLDFVGNNNNIRSKKIIINDFISANLFYEYYKNLKNKKI